MRIDFVALALFAQLTFGLSGCQDDEDDSKDEAPQESQDQVVLPPPVVLPVAGSPETPVVTPPTVAGAPVQPLPDVPGDEGVPSEQPVVTQPATPIVTQPGAPVVPDPAAPVLTTPEAPVLVDPVAPIISEPTPPTFGENSQPPLSDGASLNRPAAVPETQPQPQPEPPAPAQPVAQPETPAVPEDRALVAVFGDSISTGVLANTRLGQYIGAQAQEWLAKLFSGDVTSRLEAERALSYPDLSAASSSQDYGLRSSIAAARALPQEQVDLVNLAEFGAMSDALPMMAERLQTAENNLGRKADTIFVMLGSNDFCSMNSVEDFQVTYENGLALLLKEHPDSTYILAPLPGIQQLADINYTYIPALPGMSGATLSCNTLHRHACNRLNDDDAGARVAAMNQSIYAVAEKLKANVGAARVKTVPAIAAWQIQPEQLAFDCFHPSALGQEALGWLIGDALKTQ